RGPHLTVDFLAYLGMVSELEQARRLDPVLLRPRRRDLGVEHHERGDERPSLTDHARLTDELLGLQRGLEVRRRDVLTAGGDDELLLPVDDAQVPVVVEDTDVTRVQPALRV